MPLHLRAAAHLGEVSRVDTSSEDFMSSLRREKSLLAHHFQSSALWPFVLRGELRKMMCLRRVQRRSSAELCSAFLRAGGFGKSGSIMAMPCSLSSPEVCFYRLNKG